MIENPFREIRPIEPVSSEQVRKERGIVERVEEDDAWDRNKEIFSEYLRSGNLKQAQIFRKRQRMTDEVAFEILMPDWIRYCKKGRFDQLLDECLGFHIDKNLLKHQEFLESVKSGYREILSEQYDEGDEDRYHFPGTYAKPLDVSEASDCLEDLGLQEAVFADPRVERAHGFYLQHVFRSSAQGDFEEARKMFDRLKLQSSAKIGAHFDFMNDVRIPGKIKGSEEVYYRLFDVDVPPAALRARMTHELSPDEYLAAQRRQPQCLERNEKGKIRDPRAVLEWLSADKSPDIAQNLQDGAAAFGAARMLRYMNRPDLSRHDAVFFFADLMTFLQRNGISVETFGADVLEQIPKDDSAYPEGTAHQRLASVIQKLSYTSIEDFFQSAEPYRKDITQLNAVLSEIEKDPSNFFLSWKGLKKYAELVDLLGRKETMDLLVSIENPRLKEYAETLLFNENIATDAVKLFVEKPEEFFDIDDRHAPEMLSHVKKPSNLLTLPHLGMNAEDLRDALVGKRGETDSALDRLQELPPFEAEYRVGPEPRQESLPEQLHDVIVNVGIGKLREKKPGIAKNPKKLLTEVQRLLGSIDREEIFPASAFPAKDSALRFRTFADPEKGPRLLERLREVSPEMYQQLQSIAYDATFGIELKDDRPTYRVRVGKKSDPTIAIAGNDTASCMPFGSGKNNVYQINPNCSQLVVERKIMSGSKDSTWRTAAQSVMTLDYRASRTVPSLMRLYAEDGAMLSDVLQSGDLVQKPVLTFDNIEVAKNDLGSRLGEIREAYERFTKAYLSQHAAERNIDPTKAVVGQNYTPRELGFPEVDNYFVSAAPTSYSDNTREKCDVISTGVDDANPLPRFEKLAHVGIRDILSVAYLEGKAYADNPSLLEYLHKIQNDIIGMKVANELFDRPDLSSIYRDEKGVPKGYLIAYEGVATERGSDRMVYISDMASDPEGRLVTGGRLLQAFTKAFVDAYAGPDKIPPPIFTNARERTSYRLIQNHAQALSKRVGLEARVVELGEYSRGGDMFHDVVIVFGKSAEDLDVAEGKAREALLR